MGMSIMNKITVVEDKIVQDGEYIIDFKKNNTIKIQGNVTIHDLNNNNSKQDIILKNDSSLSLYQVKKLDNDYEINITLLNNTKFNYHMRVLNKDKHTLKINIDMLESNAFANIELRAINTTNNSNIDIICTGNIKENTKDNELIENLKGLITKENDTIKISPIMNAHTNLVTASHLVTIGSFKTEDLFYLEAKGLSENKAKEILYKSFIKHNMKDIDLESLKLGGE